MIICKRLLNEARLSATRQRQSAVTHPSLCCHILMSVLPSLSFLSKTALLLLLLQKTASLLIQNQLPATCCCCRLHSSVNSGNPASTKLLLLLLETFLSLTCFNPLERVPSPQQRRRRRQRRPRCPTASHRRRRGREIPRPTRRSWYTMRYITITKTGSRKRDHPSDHSVDHAELD